MKTITFILFLFVIEFSQIRSQEHNVKIEIQLIGYDGFSPLTYSISNSNGLYNQMHKEVQPDSSGRIVIFQKINSTQFFRFHFRNKNEKKLRHECRLILQPDKNYTVISKGQNDNSYVPYSPDLYSWKNNDGDHQTFYKMDMGQINYNLFDNGASGFLFREEWDLLQPDSLLKNLSSKIDKQVEIYRNLLSKGDIDPEFFEIAKLNVEYFNAYRLAITIESGWIFPYRYGIKDSLINKKLIDVYRQLFELFPVKGRKLENFFEFDRYIDAYLYYLECFKDGNFSIPKKNFSSIVNRIDEIKPDISPKVYHDIKLRNILSQVASFELESSKPAKDYLEKNPAIRQTTYGKFLENTLIPESVAFDTLLLKKLSKDAVLLDEQEPIRSYSQLTGKLKNKPFLINFWGTWCGPCRDQFYYKDSLYAFLNKSGIEMIYAAYEYYPDRPKWKKTIAAYDLKGVHLMINDDFRNDLKKHGGEITGFPAFMLINRKGEIVESNAYMPGDGEKLFKQIKEKLIDN